MTGAVEVLVQGRERMKFPNPEPDGFLVLQGLESSRISGSLPQIPDQGGSWGTFTQKQGDVQEK